MAGLREIVIAARMVGVGAGVDDELDGLLGERANGGESLRAHLRKAGVDEHDGIFAELNGDVGAGADEHVDAALHMEQLHGGFFGRRILLRTGGGRPDCE